MRVVTAVTYDRRFLPPGPLSESRWGGGGDEKQDEGAIIFPIGKTIEPVYVKFTV